LAFNTVNVSRENNLNGVCARIGGAGEPSELVLRRRYIAGH
jgi:hypothetical protein